MRNYWISCENELNGQNGTGLKNHLFIHSETEWNRTETGSFFDAYCTCIYYTDRGVCSVAVLLK